MAPLASVRASRAWQRLFFAEAERSSAGRDAEASPLRWAPWPSPPHLPFLNGAHPSSPLVPSRKPLCRDTAPVLGPRDRPTVSNRLGTSPAPSRWPIDHIEHFFGPISSNHDACSITFIEEATSTSYAVMWHVVFRQRWSAVWPRWNRGTQRKFQQRFPAAHRSCVAARDGYLGTSQHRSGALVETLRPAFVARAGDG